MTTTFPVGLTGRDGRLVDETLILRDIADGYVIGDENETGVAFSVDACQCFKVVLAVSAVSGTTDGSNYWTVNVQVSDLVNGAYTTIGSHQASGSAEQVELAFTRSRIEALDADAAFIRVGTALTGSTAFDITYGAWIVPG